jgi:hypothetical protein
VPILSLLLKNRSPLNATDNEGYTPLHHAIAEGHGKFLSPLQFPVSTPSGVLRFRRDQRVVRDE